MFCLTLESFEEARAREHRSKANADRPSCIISPALKGVATRLDFSGDSELSLAGTDLEAGMVIPELAAKVARVPRSRALPVETSRKSARGTRLTEGPVLERAIRWSTAKDPGTSSKAHL
jgi:hypothetical protein